MKTSLIQPCSGELMANGAETMATILSGVYLCLVTSARGGKELFLYCRKIPSIQEPWREISVVQLNALFLEQSIETRWRESGYTACFGDIVACEGYEIKEVLLLDIGIG